jgi:hypothetical protein
MCFGICFTVIIVEPGEKIEIGKNGLIVKRLPYISVCADNHGIDL